MQFTIYIVKQSQGQWGDAMEWDIKAFTKKTVADALADRLNRCEYLGRIKADADGEYMDYSSFHVHEVELSDIDKLR